MDKQTKSVMDDPVLMESHLKEAMHRTKDDLKLSKDEEDRLTKAFKEPEFKKLMSEYLEEISDPKNKAEYDAYINQLEKDNKVPKGTKLVRPDSGFCVKTKKQGTGEKVFINICSAIDAGLATSKSTTKGQTWNLPHMMGPPHMEQDKNKTPCMTFDVCFHPDTLKRGFENIRFQQLLVTTALETIQEKTTKFGQTVKLERNYRILKGVKAMGGKPNMLSVKLDENETSTATAKTKSTNSMTAAASSLLSKKNKNQKKKKNKKNEKETNEIFKCVIVESGQFDMRDYMESDAKHRVHRHRPTKLVIRVTLPGLKSLENVELDVSERALVLVVPGKPKFERKLPYPVNSDKGKAKFHKNRSLLEVTVPVLPPAPEEIVEEEEEEENNEIDSENKEMEVEQIETQEHSTKETKKEEKKEEHENETTKAEANKPTMPSESITAPGATSINVDDTQVAEEKETTAKKMESIPAGIDPEMMKKIREARAAYANWSNKGTENNVKAVQAAEKEAEEIRVENQGKMPLLMEDDDATHVVDTNAVSFIEATAFDGAKPGYVFKKGISGVGYYLDTKGRRTRTQKRTVPTKTSAPTFENVTDTEDTDGKVVEDIFLDTNEDTKEPVLMLEIPPHRFRQDKRSLTLLVQIAGIEEAQANVHFTTTSVTIHFVASNNKEYALRLLPPKGMTLLPTQSRFSVSQRNMAVVVAKENPEKWGADMKIEAITASDIIVLKKNEKVVEESSNPSAPEVGTASLLSNTLMYDLS